MRRPISILLGLTGLAVLTFAGVRAIGEHRQSPPNVLLLSIDTLRADHLGCYGGTVATPNVDRIAIEGVLFENAACPMPMTRPSLTTVHTSLHPRQHGVVNNGIALPDDAVTLAEVLRDAGYATAAFTPVRLLDATSGLAQGFDTYVAPDAHHVPADKVAPRALGWLASRDAQKPFFVWLHLFDPHLPYAPPAGYVQGEGVAEVSWRSLVATARANDGDVPASVLQRALDLYAGEVAYTDHWVGEVLATLERLDVLDDTVVVFTADHGECFDHGIYFEHSDCLYDGAAKVPLLIRYPERIDAATRVEPQVEHLDLAPTILALAGVPAPPSFRGHTLVPMPAEPADELAPARFALVEHPLYHDRNAQERARKQDAIRSVGGVATRPILIDRQSAAVRSAAWKLIAEGDASEVYALRDDPHEATDLATKDPAVTTALRGVLEQKHAEHPLVLRQSEDVNPRLRETLKALGYVQ